MFPVRDSKICAYLADNSRLGGKTAELGWFQRDIQVLAHLITHPNVQRLIGDVREELARQHPTWAIDWSDLRILDIVLWMQAAHLTKRKRDEGPKPLGSGPSKGPLEVDSLSRRVAQF